MPESDSVKIVVAVIAACASVIVAIVTAVLSYFNMKIQQRSQAELSRELEILKSDLANSKAEKDARLDYQYDARKRLYEQCEPLLFQLIERSEDAHHRIYSLARTARQGDLGPVRRNWLATEEYYLRSTSYKLFAPMVIVQLLQRLLTLVDLTVDPSINIQYKFAKSLYLTFTGDHSLAEKDPLLDYEPQYIRIMTGQQLKHPEVECKQGIVAGQLDNAIEAMTVIESNGRLRCMSFGEFEKVCQDQHSPAHQTLRVVTDLFYNFHPKTRPVLWRILIAQAHIYEAILRSSEIKLASKENDITLALLKPISQGNRQKLDWRQTPEESEIDKVFADPYLAAQAYLEQRITGVTFR